MAIRANRSGGNLRFEPHLNVSADKLCATMEPSHDTNIVLGVPFLTHISDDLEAKRPGMSERNSTDEEDTDEYVAETVDWLPSADHSSQIQTKATQLAIGKNIADTILVIDANNVFLLGILSKECVRPALNKVVFLNLNNLPKWY